MLKFLLEPIGWYRLTHETRLGVVRTVNPIRYAREIIGQAQETYFQITMMRRSRYTFRPRLQLSAESWDTEAWLRVSSITRVPVKNLTIDESRMREILAFEEGDVKVRSSLVNGKIPTPIGLGLNHSVEGNQQKLSSTKIVKNSLSQENSVTQAN